jgi:hypothetical protein
LEERTKRNDALSERDAHEHGRIINGKQAHGRERDRRPWHGCLASEKEGRECHGVSDEQVGILRDRSRVLVRFVKRRQDEIAYDVTASGAPIHGAAEDVRVRNVDVQADGMKRDALSFNEFAIHRRARNHGGMTSAVHLAGQGEDGINVAE